MTLLKILKRKKKKIKLYGPIIKGEHTDYCYMRGDYHSDKSGVHQLSKEDIVGWHEITVSVDNT